MTQPTSRNSPSLPAGMPPRHTRSSGVMASDHYRVRYGTPEFIGDQSQIVETSRARASAGLSSAREPQAVTHLDFSVPRNTGIVGAVVTRSTLRLPCDISFVDFWSRVCGHMDLDPAEAMLGYKFSVDQARDLPRSLSDENELSNAIEHGQGLVCRARTRKIEIIIHNLKPATKSASGTKNPKRKEPGEDTIGSPTVVDFTNELRQLKEHLLCATHHGRWCHVSPINGDHKTLDIFTLTLWAKKILLKEATLDEPPNILQFDHPTKKRRTSPSHAVNPGGMTPAIHVHLGNLPLNEVEGQRLVNRDAEPSKALPQTTVTQSLSDNDSDDLVAYPSIEVLLSDLGQVMPHVDFSPYYAVFTRQGFFYVDSIDDLDDNFLISDIGLPRGVIKQFKKHAARLTRRAEKAAKGKSSVVVSSIPGIHGSEKENRN